MLPLPVPVPGSWFQGLGNRAPLRYPDVTPPSSFSPQSLEQAFMYAMSDEESRHKGGPGSGVGPCQELEPGSWPQKGFTQAGSFTRGLGTVSDMQLEAFPEPPTSLPSSLCVACSLSHSFSSAKFIFSLLLPRSQDCRCTHVAWLPGQGGWGGWAGKGGFNFGGRVEVSILSNPRLMSQGLWPSPPGSGSQFGV